MNVDTLFQCIKDLGFRTNIVGILKARRAGIITDIEMNAMQDELAKHLGVTIQKLHNDVINCSVFMR